MSQSTEMLSMLTAAAVGMAALGQAYHLAIALPARVAPRAVVARCVVAAPSPPAPPAGRMRT